jgi:hypothetical protein
MQIDYKWDLKRVRAEGFELSDRPMTAGPYKSAEGCRQIADLLSDLPNFINYAEVQLKGKRGRHVWIKVPQLVSNPHIFVGYQPSGHVALLPAFEATNGHLGISGPSGSRKSTRLALILYQLIRLGFPVILIGFKAIDYILLAALKAAADSKTRLDPQGNRVGTTFSFVTLQPNVRCKGLTGLFQPDANVPIWLRAAQLLDALGQGGGVTDPARRFFRVCGQELLLRVPDWGSSIRDLHNRISTLRLNEKTAYNTAGFRNELAQLAAIEVANLPETHPAAVNLSKVIAENSVVYVDAYCQGAGETGSAFGGVVLDAAIAAKQKVDPTNSKRVVIPLDESQQLGRAQLKLKVEQTRGFNTSLMPVYHSASQFGAEDWESICMCRTRIICGAVPGGFTDQVLLPHMFGKKTIYPMSFSESDGVTLQISTGTTSGPVGGSVSFGTSSGDSKQKNVGFSEQEAFAWGPNETLELNADFEKSVLHVSPPCGLAQFGPKPIICEQPDLLLSFDEIRRISNDVLSDKRDTFIPGKCGATDHVLPELSHTAMEKRSALLKILDSAAARFRTRDR